MKVNYSWRWHVGTMFVLQIIHILILFTTLIWFRGHDIISVEPKAEVYLVWWLKDLPSHGMTKRHEQFSVWFKGKKDWVTILLCTPGGPWTLDHSASIFWNTGTTDMNPLFNYVTFIKYVLCNELESLVRNWNVCVSTFTGEWLSSFLPHTSK